jgi:Right handed beta helix region
MKRLFLFAGLSSFLLFFAASGQAVAGTVQLCPLLSSGGIVSLSSANTYVLPASPGQCWLSKSVTINGNGATISGIGPIGSTKAGVTIILNSANYSSSGWAAIAAQGGSNVAVQNSSISCPSGTGVDVSTGSTATVQNSSIFSSTYGVQVVSPASASLHGVTITGCPYAVLANGPSASVTIDGNSLLQYQVSQTSGVGIVNGASGVVHDTTIQGFLNGVDVTPTDGSTASGTVDVENCLFDTNGCSSLSARYAHGVHFSNSTVTNAQGDGIYFYHSTGVIDKSQIIGSLNSGVSFEACPDGATIQNSLVRDSAHQGINVVECQVFPCPAPVTPSLNIKVLNNTLVNNQIANILVTQNESRRRQSASISAYPWPPYSLAPRESLWIPLL